MGNMIVYINVVMWYARSLRGKMKRAEIETDEVQHGFMTKLEQMRWQQSEKKKISFRLGW
jgi:high-affinity nickel permease